MNDPTSLFPSDSLTGVRVVDFSLNLAGPYCGQILADLGADVVKVERPGAGDPARDWAPPAWGGDGTLFLAANRGKRSVAVDLGSSEGQEVRDRLLDGADVVIQAFRPDVARRFGLTEEALDPASSGRILCSITAFGEEGDDARPGYDPLLQAHAGLMSVTGPEEGPPVRVGTSMVDLGAGMWSALGVLAALRSRDLTGQGSHVRTSLLDVALGWGAYHIMGTLATGRPPRAMGTRLGMISPYGSFPTSDGHLMIAAGNDELFSRLCAALELSRLLDDPRFATNPDRVEHREALETMLAEVTMRFTRGELEETLRRAGVPCAAIRDMGEVARDPEILQGTLRAEDHPRIADYRAVALPVTWNRERAPARRPPPAVGEHTEEVLNELGYTAPEIEALKKGGAVA